MYKNDKQKILIILALLLSISGMALGFAAFSSTLNISSSATITPNSNDFDLNIYGLNRSKNLNELASGFEESWLSDTIAYANIEGSNVTATVGTIDNKNFSISGLQANYTNSSGVVEYYFLIKNDGKYTANLKYSEFEKFFDQTIGKTCTPGNGTSPVLVNKACEAIEYGVALGDVNIENGAMSVEGQLLNSMVGIAPDFDSSIAISPGNGLFLCIAINLNPGILPDGPMTVTFDNIQFNFSTK